jgi:hypothetical protein
MDRVLQLALPPKAEKKKPIETANPVFHHLP